MPLPESVRDLLGNNNILKYRIPYYQRDYTWTTENTDELFNDIVNRIDSTSNALIGLVVFVEDPSGDRNPRTRRLEVVDGQQRLTTISLILAAIRCELSSIPHSSMDQELAEQVWGVSEEIEKLLFRVTPSEGEKKHTLLSFENETLLHARIFSGLCCNKRDLSYIKSPLKEEDILFLSQGMASNPNQNAVKQSWLKSQLLFDQRVIRGSNTRKNFDHILESIKKFAPDSLTIFDRVARLKQLKQTLLQHITIIVYETQDYEEAFQLFETLNTRGLDVNASDLVKNHCIRIDSSRRIEIGQLWQQIFENITVHHQPVYFLRVVYNSMWGFASKAELYRAYTERLTNNAERWLRTELIHDAQRFVSMMQNLALNTNANSQLKNTLFCLNCTSSTQWHTLGLSSVRLLEHHRFSAPLSIAVQELLLETLKATLVMEIKKVRGSVLERKLPELARQIHQLINANSNNLANDINEIRRDLKDHRQRNELNSEGISDYIDKRLFKNEDARPLLAFLRLQSQHQGSAFLNLTVEHVYPREPRDIWDGWDENNKIVTSYLGNFISLEGSTNSSLSNTHYEQKKAAYLSVNAPDTFGSNSPLHYSNINLWTPDIVIARTKELARQIEQDLL